MFIMFWFHSLTSTLTMLIKRFFTARTPQTLPANIVIVLVLGVHTQRLPWDTSALPSRWMDKVHVPNGKAPLSWLPEMPLLLPDKVLREVLVQVLAGSVRMLLVGLEPLCQVSHFGRRTLQDCLRIMTLLEVNLLLILQVDRKAIDRGKLLVHWGLKQVPACLHRTNITCINVLLDLIHRSYLHSGTVWALVDVLVDVLDSLD
jgi:hypothetical protein